jgi:hypothetical protein
MRHTRAKVLLQATDVSNGYPRVAVTTGHREVSQHEKVPSA